MATVMKRHRSRRRVAALTFLSNISLDGTYRDTKLALLSRNGSFANFDRVAGSVPASCSSSRGLDKENVNNRYPFAAAGSHSAEKSSAAFAAAAATASAACSAGVEADHSLMPHLQQRQQQQQQQQESFLTEGPRTLLAKIPDDAASVGGFEAERSNTALDKGSRKKLVSQPVLHSGSSTESLGGRSRKTSGSVSDSSANSSSRELRFLKGSKDPTIRDERVVLLSTKKVPSYIFTTVPHQRRSHQNSWKNETKMENNRRRHASSGNRPLSTISDGPDGMFDLFGLVRSEDGQDVSFSQLLVPSRSFFQRRFLSQEPEPVVDKNLAHLQLARCFSYDATTSQRNSGSPPPECMEDRAFEYDDVASLGALNVAQYSSFHYSPNLLDDPEFVAGKHRTVLNFASYMTSVIDYVRPSDLKRELNDKFRNKFPHIQLTLSKLRSIKREMRKIAKQECNIDLLTVAQAFVYFEKLILKNLVNKQNRKLCAGACLMLSAKLNDVKGNELKQLIEKIESTFRLNRRDLLTSEFAVLVALEFSLHLPTWEIFPLYQRVLYES